MGNNEVWAQPNGLLPNGSTNVTRVLDMERWWKAEERTTELITSIQPNKPSEERRNAVASYVQRLITNCFSCQVFTFGSVPLKTYLPDGDIDVTAMSENESLKDTWANKVRDVLESEEKSENAEFHVKEVQYIQAEVKIIKCLVENIVVDISFNQVGGLCTLCFLEEIDHLINQNHLFKRSVILIKAWCYYESRILGAHHGLISTYALETLVLYIFHVFNNSFAGPLEVLFRFLEFFSNFDWDNFCVSLWGPVPISSLPDITAEPPRKDSGELLLSKLFLHACSSVYAVLPGGHENQSQPFFSKHFNVIDPLRTSNNLGRSVSKGNFFRIRSALSFGAKRLARLLDCPKANVIAEVNQFFMNTWERHGSGCRPDASIPSLGPPKTVPTEEGNFFRSTTSIKKKSDNVPRAEPGHASQGFSSQTQNSRNLYMTSTSPMASRSQSQSNNSTRSNSMDSENQFERKTSSSGTFQGDEGHKESSGYSVHDHEGQSKYHISRTQSSPELTETFQGTVIRGVSAGRMKNTTERLDYNNRRNILNSEVSVSHSTTTRPSVDSPTLRHSSSHQSLEASADSNSVSNSYHDDTGFVSMGEELGSLFEALEIHQEEQDLVNMMASTRLHSFNGPVQLPMHLASPHGPLQLSPVLSSISYAQRNVAGMAPSNLSLVAPSFRSNVHFTQGFVPPALPHYFHAVGSNPNHDNAVESGNESYGMVESNPEDRDNRIFHESYAVSAQGFDSDSGTFLAQRFDDRWKPSTATLNSVPPSRGSSSGAPVVRSQHKFAREDRGSIREDYADASQYQTGKGNDSLPNVRSENLRTSSSRNKSSSESSRDGSSAKASKSTRQKWGTNPASSAVPPPLSRKLKSGWQFEGASSNASVHKDDDDKEWVPLSTVSTDVVERVSGSGQLPFRHAKSHQLTGYEPAQMSRSDPMIPIAPFLVGSSRLRSSDNSGAVPFAFYPTGPPVPFLTMLPLYDYPSDTGNSDGSKSHLDKDETEDHNCLAPFGQHFESTGNLERSEARMSSTASKHSTTEPSEERHKPDILNGDFASHWQNLQYGRFCQNTRNHTMLIYPSPVAVPPGYLQGHVSWDGPVRPVSNNLNFTQGVGGYGGPMAPATPMHPGPNRPSGVFQHYGDESPRYRRGTGTFLPNPAPFRERQFSGTRNHRGNYNYDRSEDNDREGSWSSSKPRAAGRNHGRNQFERPTSRLDRSSATENPANDRSWDPSRRGEPVAWHEAQNSSSFGPSSSSRSAVNTTYGMFSMPAAGSNSANPTGGGHPTHPLVMFYPYDQGVECGSAAVEPLEFGSLGPLRLSGKNEETRPGEAHPVRGLHQQRHGQYHGGSSPDQPSSHQVQRCPEATNCSKKKPDAHSDPDAQAQLGSTRTSTVLTSEDLKDGSHPNLDWVSKTKTYNPESLI